MTMDDWIRVAKDIRVSADDDDDDSSGGSGGGGEYNNCADVLFECFFFINYFSSPFLSFKKFMRFSM